MSDHGAAAVDSNGDAATTGTGAPPRPCVARRVGFRSGAPRRNVLLALTYVLAAVAAARLAGLV